MSTKRVKTKMGTTVEDSIKPREIEEALEDPFAVRLLPDQDRRDGEDRYYALGRTVADRYLFLSFKAEKVIAFYLY